MTGLLVDEWVEVVPNTRETTALAFQFDVPDACAPQSVLIAVPPVPGQDWTAETLRRVLMETLDLAKLRAVDTESLGAAAQHLPGLYLAFNTEDHAVSTDFAARDTLSRVATGCIMPPQLFFDITLPTGVARSVGPHVSGRAATSRGCSSRRTGRSISKSVTVQFGPGGPTVAGDVHQRHVNWQCTGTGHPATPWGSFVQLTISAQATFRFFTHAGEPDFATLNVSTTFMVRLFPADRADHQPRSVRVADRRRAAAVSTSRSPDRQRVRRRRSQVVQYKVEGGQFANAVNVSGNWSQFRITLPLPPTAARPATTRSPFARSTRSARPARSRSPSRFSRSRRSSFRQAAKTTFSGAPTTSSITSWTRLEPQCTDADMGTSSSARVFDPLWMLTRQWQMGEFQAEDAGTPIQARVRATSAMLTPPLLGRAAEADRRRRRRRCGAGLRPGATPLEVLVERRRDARGRREGRAHADVRGRVRTALPADARAAGAVEELSSGVRHEVRTSTARAGLRRRSVDDATVAVHAVDGRPRARRTAAGALAAHDAAPRSWCSILSLNIAVADRAEGATGRDGVARVVRLDVQRAARVRPMRRGIRRGSNTRLSVGARLSANARDEMTFSATEIDGPIDWSSFDVNTQASLTTAADQSVHVARRSHRFPRPVSFPGAPAPRFWEMEDARLAYGLRPGRADRSRAPDDDRVRERLRKRLVRACRSRCRSARSPASTRWWSPTRLASAASCARLAIRRCRRAFFSMWQPSLKPHRPAPRQNRH